MQTTDVSTSAYTSEPIHRAHQHNQVRIASTQTSITLFAFEIPSGWMYQGIVTISRGSLYNDVPRDSQPSCGTATVGFIATYSGGLNFLMASSAVTSVASSGANYMPNGYAAITQLITGMTAAVVTGKPGVTLTVTSLPWVTTMDFAWEFSAIYTG